MKNKKAPAKISRRKKINLPELNYRINKFSDYEEATKADNVRAFVYMNLLRAVSECMENNATEADLFLIKDSNFSVAVDKQEWKPCLNSAMDFFSDNEMFDVCIMCRDIIAKL